MKLIVEIMEKESDVWTEQEKNALMERVCDLVDKTETQDYEVYFA